jgi:hypothetical protein
MTYTPPLKPPKRPVSDEGSLLAFERYADMIKKKGYEPVNHTEIEDGDPTHPEHLLWMCEHCKYQVRDDGQGMSVDKYSRWLGFIQGCLIYHGFITVENERNITRIWFKKEK